MNCGFTLNTFTVLSFEKWAWFEIMVFKKTTYITEENSILSYDKFHPKSGDGG